jgi:scyllo-inositol 2-dehydrogenase (NADP+)
MNVNGRIPVAVIGSGWVVEHRHLPALAGDGRFSIQTIVGQREDRLRELSRKFGIPRYVCGPAQRSAAWMDGIRAVMVGVPPMHHYAVASYVLGHGLHLLMEKPMTVDIRQSRALVALARKKGVRFAAVHNFQFSRSVLALRADIDAGKLGTVTGLLGWQLGNPKRRLPEWEEELSWGLFFDESPHLLYLLSAFGGNLKLTGATASFVPGKRSPREVSAQFTAEGGIPATFWCHDNAAVSEWYFTVIGTDGIGIVDIFRDIYIHLPNDGAHVPRTILATSATAIVQHLIGSVRTGWNTITGRSLYGNETVVGKFADAILTGADLGPIDGARAIRINELQFAIMNAAKS